MNRRNFIALTAANGTFMIATKTQAQSAKAAKIVHLRGSPDLCLRHMRKRGARAVLYVHGATFPSALAVGYRFGDGLSWEQQLQGAGFDTWALDFEGFGASSRPASFSSPSVDNPPALRSTQAVLQIARAVEHIKAKTGQAKVSIIAHSWGSVPAAAYAGHYNDNVDQLVLFGPVVRRAPTTAPQAPAVSTTTPPPTLPAWRYVSVAEQLARFTHDTPADHANVLAEPSLATWGPAWLASDPTSSSRTPPTVQIPTGSTVDIGTLWSGRDLYDPTQIKAKTLIIRGEWDSVSSANDATTLLSRLSGCEAKIATIATSGHLAHLEANRDLLWRAVSTFLIEGTAT